jgi:hypothetical protein
MAMKRLRQDEARRIAASIAARTASTWRLICWSKTTTSTLTEEKRRGLYKLPPDAIVKARDDTAAQVNRISLTFVGTVIFCVLSLLTPDTAY